MNHSVFSVLIKSLELMSHSSTSCINLRKIDRKTHGFLCLVELKTLSLQYYQLKDFCEVF